MAALSAWALVSACFVCLYLLPGDPARLILGPQASAASVALFRSEAGLDQPLGVQYAAFLERFVHLDLGYSFAQRQAVTELVATRGATSLTLALSALLIATAVGVGLPLALAGRPASKLGRVLAVALQAVAYAPPYLLALGLLFLASAGLGVAPVVFDPRQAGSWIVAGAALALYPTALLMRLVQQALENQLASAHVLGALGRGARWPTLVFREALPNIAPQVLAALANSLAFFFTSAFFIEAALGANGLGRLAQEAIRQKDLPTLNGICLAYGLVVLLLGSLLELALAALDPHKVHG